MRSALLALVLLLATPAAAQIRYQSFPWVVLDYGFAGPSGSGSTSVAFTRHGLFGPDGRPAPGEPSVWTAERKTEEAWRIGARAGQAETRTQWIDGRKCPALVTVIEDLDNLPAATPYALRDLPKPRMQTPPLHSSGWRLKRWGQAGSSDVALTLLDPTGDLIGPWWKKASAALEACWTDERPPLE